MHIIFQCQREKAFTGKQIKFSHTYKHTYYKYSQRRRNLKFKIAESRQWIPKDIYFNLRILTMWKIQSNMKLSTTIQSRVMISLWYHFIYESILLQFFGEKKPLIKTMVNGHRSHSLRYKIAFHSRNTHQTIILRCYQCSCIILK